MNILAATTRYEHWLRGQADLNKRDLTRKHEAMRESPFLFLRATFYRWVEQFPELLPKLNDAPQVLCIGDLHVENFGTWRDAEGRLVWGINDFDEAFELPYTSDLVRLAVTARMAIKDGEFDIPLDQAAAELLRGYADCLENGPRPFVLAEDHPKLRALAEERLVNPQQFWGKLRKAAAKRNARKVDRHAVHHLKHILPGGGNSDCIFFNRVAGKGSLGKTRVVALENHAGGAIARETKSLTSSAAVWLTGATPPSRYQQIIDGAVAAGGRCADPFLVITEKWITRRLAPDCARIELNELSRFDRCLRLIRAMGWETANIHHGTPKGAKAILKDLHNRRKGWLTEAAQTMGRAVREDWRAYASR